MAIGDSQQDLKRGRNVENARSRLHQQQPVSGFFQTRLPLVSGPHQASNFVAEHNATAGHNQYAGAPRPFSSSGPNFGGPMIGRNRGELLASARLADGQAPIKMQIRGWDAREIEWSLPFVPIQKLGLVEADVREIFRAHGAGEQPSRHSVSTAPRVAHAPSNLGLGLNRLPDLERTRSAPSPLRFVPQPIEGQPNQRIAPQEVPFREVHIPRTEQVDIHLGNDEEVQAYYFEVFQNIQQLTLKHIMKEWIKEIEPKKQKNFPYSKDKAESQGPPWWPTPMRHCEPDHLNRSERDKLGWAILTYVMDEPKFFGKGLKRLEGASNIKMQKFDDDQDANKLPYREALLKNLFTLAYAHQEVKRGERDDDERIFLPKILKYEKPRPIKHSRKRATSSSKSKPNETKRRRVQEPSVKPEDAADISTHSHTAPSSPQQIQHGLATAVNTPAWELGPAVPPPTFPHIEQPQSQLPQQWDPHLMSSAQAYSVASSVDSRFGSFDGSMVDSTSSPMMPFPSSATSVGSNQMAYPSPSPHPESSFQPHGLSLPEQHMQHMPMVFTAINQTEDPHWAPTPGYLAPTPPVFGPFGNSPQFSHTL